MKYIFVSDIHGNVERLKEALIAIREEKLNYRETKEETEIIKSALIAFRILGISKSLLTNSTSE